MSGINGIFHFIYHLCQTVDCHLGCYFTKLEKQWKNNISFYKKLYNRLVFVPSSNATKPNCGNLLKFTPTTSPWKHREGTRIMTDPNGNNGVNWKTRILSSTISYMQEITKMVQRLDGFGRIHFLLRYSPICFERFSSYYRVVSPTPIKFFSLSFYPFLLHKKFIKLSFDKKN